MINKTNKKKILISFVIIMLLIALNTYISSNYVIMMPGITRDLKEIITVEGGQKHDEGAFLLTAVSTRTANIPLLFYVVFDPYTEIIAKKYVIPQGWNMDDYLKYMKKWMEESKMVAKVVALKKAGFETEIHGEGVEVVKIMQGSHALGKIKPGDIIVEVDGEKVTLADQLVSKILKHKVDDIVYLKVIRENKEYTYGIKTVENAVNKGKASLGIYVTTYNWKPVLPKDISIKTDEIGGPSAGAMFTLEILNQLQKENLTNNKKIAGTGTISLNGEIGEIGGTLQKVITAQRDGASIFFVPKGNMDDLKKIKDQLKINVIPVSNLDEMLNYLKNIKT
ncbi:MAG: Lon-like protease [Thermosediminibacterales bacterium]|nr:Lon-like protease [Thermosediminibacterales bacterium]MDK2835444.1 Lon-like protease [Thermosediminibacterales bacterium]